MKRFSLTVLSFFVIFSFCSAQITLTSADVAKFYEAGKYQINVAASNVPVNVGNASSSAQSFSFSFTPTDTIIFTNYAVPQQTEPFNKFSNATHVSGFTMSGELVQGVTFISTIYQFVRIANDSMISVGGATRQQITPATPPFSADTTTYFHYYEPLLTFPLTHGFSITTIDTTFDEMDTTYIVTTSTQKVNGFGSMTIPQGTYQVLRMLQTDIDRLYSVNSGALIGIDTVHSISFISAQGVRVEIEIQHSSPIEGATMASSAALLYTSNSTMGMKNQHAAVVDGFQLNQNFPNPFNPSTTISFVLQTSGFTTLKVYDILGKEVATLVNSTMDAGSHSIPFDASPLPSGIYFYKLQSGNLVQTKKMMLTK